MGLYHNRIKFSIFFTFLKKFNRKTFSLYAFGETFSHSPSPREVYFPFGGIYNPFCFIGKQFPMKQEHGFAVHYGDRFRIVHLQKSIAFFGGTCNYFCFIGNKFHFNKKKPFFTASFCYSILIEETGIKSLTSATASLISFSVRRGVIKAISFSGAPFLSSTVIPPSASRSLISVALFSLK